MPTVMSVYIWVIYRMLQFIDGSTTIQRLDFEIRQASVQILPLHDILIHDFRYEFIII